MYFVFVRLYLYFDLVVEPEFLDALCFLGALGKNVLYIMHYIVFIGLL